MPQQPEQKETLLGDWIRHRDAAAMMGVNEKYLRPDPQGKYLYFLELRRIRPQINGKPGKFIYLLRSEVLAWKARQEAAAEPAIEYPSANRFENLREVFAGKPGLLRQLGLQS